MLYIRGHKIIKGYIGNTPISHVGFGKSGLIKIKSENGGSDYPNNLIAKYTTNTSGVLPTFNSEYQYTINETESNGIYTVELFSDDDFTSCSFRGKTQLLTVEYLKVTSKVTDMADMFQNCTQLTQLDISDCDTSNVTSMNDIFGRCYALNSIIGIEDLDVSSVTTMIDMFYYCKSLTSLDLSNWDTKNVTNMRYMFSDCYMLQTLNVTGWDTSNVTNMEGMFGYYSIGNHNLKEIIGINTWDVSSVTNMYCMFWECRSLESLDLTNWDISNVTDMSWMFCDCESLKTLKLDGWHINENTKYNDLFSLYNYGGCKSLTSISMANSDYNSVNKIIVVLPTRTSVAGLLDITGVDDISLVDKETLNSKNWVLSKVGH